MPAIILPDRWRRQPSGPLEIDWSNPIAANILFAVTPNQGAVRNVVGNNFGTTYGSAGVIATASGLAVNVTGTNCAYEFPFTATPSAISLLSFATVYGNGASAGGIFTVTHSSDSGAAPYVVAAMKIGSANSERLFGIDAGGYNNTIYVSPGTSAAGSIELSIGRHKAGAQSLDVFVNGQKYSTSGTLGSGPSYGSGARAVIGEDYRLASRYSQRAVNAGIIWGRYLSDSEVAELRKNTWQVFKKSARILYFPSAGGGGATLTADSGSYALTGTAATIAAGRKLTADAGTYSLTGTAATLAVGRKLTAEPGTYSVTGTSVDFLRGYSLTAESGGYSVSGTDAAIKLGRLLAAESGSYTLTGTDVTLTYQQAGSYSLTADAGSYALTGTAAALRVTRTLTAEAGSYSLTGADVTLRRGYAVQADTGSYALTGAAVAFARTYVLGAESGSYTLTGSDAGLTWSAAPVVETPAHGGPSIYGKAVFREAEFRREYERETARIEAERIRAIQLREDEELVIIMAALAA